MNPSSAESQTFESAVAELEKVLRTLEDGNATLEDSLSQYERGVALLRSCYAQLRDAEQRILKLSGVDADGKPVLETFEHVSAVESVGERKKSSPRKTRSSDDTA